MISFLEYKPGFVLQANVKKEVVLKLITGVTLERKYNDHLLTGNVANRRECHLDPDIGY